MAVPGAPDASPRHPDRFPPRPPGRRPARRRPGLTRLRIDCRLVYELDGPCEFVFLVHVARRPDLTLLEESLQLEPATRFRSFEDAATGNHVLRLSAGPGPFSLHYRAVVERPPEDRTPDLPELPVAELPDEVLRHLAPTRYCESDHLGAVAWQLFGEHPPGRARVQAIADWVHEHIDYRIGSTTPLTTARDVFVQRAGVCRDFAHLAVALCRGLNIPARLVAGYAPFEEPPPDFHAVFEAYLGGRWVLFDPTRMSPVDHLVRIATGQDAKDVAFATLFGPARLQSMQPEITVIGGAAASA
ncbi:transglutaminase family protein [Piscinibacter sakaiensis]|uniref:transglutaminase-like domain-containing protein n=1 Tax=Piscinibacter sakaiensis TaxID=1547922 RepID=UPI003727282E